MSSTKAAGRNPGPSKGPVAEEADNGPKPLAATLMQEFKNLQDKFKNDDETETKGKLVFRIILVVIYWIYSLQSLLIST